MEYLINWKKSLEEMVKALKSNVIQRETSASISPSTISAILSQQTALIFIPPPKHIIRRRKRKKRKDFALKLNNSYWN
jgi:hypothetical protein